MKLQKSFALVLGLGVLSLLACLTINVYFPEAAVRDMAVQIEDAVQEKAFESPGTPPEETPETEPPTERSVSLPSLAGSLLAGLVGGLPAHAQVGEVAPPAVTNPAIRKIIDSRAQRAPELRKFKNQGVVGEGKDALVVIRGLENLELRERAAVQKLVKAENADRETMFKEIAAATGVDLAQLPQVRETYAETLRDKARPGDWIEMPDGTWKQKA